MIILKEVSSELNKETKVFTNKLKNMKLHLSELLNKKLRLEVEIKSLKKTIVNKQKEYERTLKVKLTMESSELMDPDSEQRLLRENPQLYFLLQEFDDQTVEIFELLEKYNPKEESRE